LNPPQKLEEQIASGTSVRVLASLSVLAQIL
jgi:hypothetical protein